MTAVTGGGIMTPAQYTYFPWHTENNWPSQKAWASPVPSLFVIGSHFLDMPRTCCDTQKPTFNFIQALLLYTLFCKISLQILLFMWKNDNNQLEEPSSPRFLRTAETGPWRTFLERRMSPETGSLPKYFTWISSPTSSPSALGWFTCKATIHNEIKSAQ